MSVRKPEPLKLVAFDSIDDPLAEFRESSQGKYLRWYLADLDAKSVLIEPAYFDRDYLSEFAAFYCTSAAGYENVCRRLHYFSDAIDRPALERAVAGDATERERFNKAYLGFVVLRPLRPEHPSHLLASGGEESRQAARPPREEEVIESVQPGGTPS